jgi:hypothetical protein
MEPAYSTVSYERSGSPQKSEQGSSAALTTLTEAQSYLRRASPLSHHSFGNHVKEQASQSSSTDFGSPENE